MNGKSYQVAISGLENPPEIGHLPNPPLSPAAKALPPQSSVVRLLHPKGPMDRNKSRVISCWIARGYLLYHHWPSSRKLDTR